MKAMPALMLDEVRLDLGDPLSQEGKLDRPAPLEIEFPTSQSSFFELKRHESRLAAGR